MTTRRLRTPTSFGQLQDVKCSYRRGRGDAPKHTEVKGRRKHARERGLEAVMCRRKGNVDDSRPLQLQPSAIQCGAETPERFPRSVWVCLSSWEGQIPSHPSETFAQEPTDLCPTVLSTLFLWLVSWEQPKFLHPWRHVQINYGLAKTSTGKIKNFFWKRRWFGEYLIKATCVNSVIHSQLWKSA